MSAERKKAIFECINLITFYTEINSHIETALLRMRLRELISLEVRAHCDR